MDLWNCRGEEDEVSCHGCANTGEGIGKHTGHKMPRIPGCSLANCDAPKAREDDAATAAAADDASLD